MMQVDVVCWRQRIGSFNCTKIPSKSLCRSPVPNPLCKCTLDDEDNLHYFRRCPQHQQYRVSLLSNISSIIGSDITILPSEHLVNLILYGSNVYNDITNNLILSETLHYIRNSARFKVLEVFS